MRQFKNYEAVKVNNAEEAMEFLQYLEDNTDLEWINGGEKPTDIRQKELNLRGFPVFIEAREDELFISTLDELEDKTKIIPLSEFLEPKVTYTREQAEAVLKDYSLFYNLTWSVSKQSVVEFLNHKFPKPILEQVTEAVMDLGDFTIEQTSTGEIIISPIKTTEQ